jgi:Flp pilus assembly protein TadG
MRKLRQLLRERRGSAAVEFAASIPVLITIVWGIFQVAIVLQANAGMQHALGEGARLATVWDPVTNAPKTDAEIQAKITSAKFGLGNGTWGTPNIDNSVANQKTITVTFSQPTDFIFFPGPTIPLTASKTVFLPT